MSIAGMRDEQQITFSGEGDQEPGLEPGDIIIVLDEKPHPVFKRSRGTDLMVEMELTLSEALCGFEKTIETLDKRTLYIKQEAGGKTCWLISIYLTILYVSLIVEL